MGKRWYEPEDTSSWRRISIGMWDAPGDPQIYGFETHPVEELLDYLEDVKKATGVNVTLNAFVIKAVSMLLEKYPEFNVMPIGSKVLRRRTNDVFCLVASVGDSPGQADLGGVKIADVDEMTVVNVAREVSERAGKLRAGEDLELEKTKTLVDYLPSFLISAAVSLVDFLTYTVPFDLDFMGIRSDPFGSAMVTSVGQFGIKQGFAPLVPSAHCPILVLPGEIHETTFAENGEPVVKRGVTFSCTFDHRCFDGYQIGCMARYFRELVTNPRDHFPDPETYR